MSEPPKNFLAQFRDPNTRGFMRVNALDFLACWQHYDKDNSGYLEGEELDGFLHEFVASIACNSEVGGEVVSAAAMEELKQEMLQAYDENEDGRISISELAQMLPTDETFLLLFGQEHALSSSVEFIRVWRGYDTENCGYITSDKLHDFLANLLKRAGKTVSDAKLKEYTKAILSLFDKDGDGKLQLAEMSRLLPVKENFLRKPLFRHASRLSAREIDRVFAKYDVDRNGVLEDDELEGFLKDLLEAVGEEVAPESLAGMREGLLAQWDENKDGKIGRDELRAILMQSARMAQEAEALRRGATAASTSQSPANNTL